MRAIGPIPYPMVAINGVPLSVVHTDSKAIAASWWHSMVLKKDGTVWATGYSRNGQLGDGTTKSKSNFVKVLPSQ